MSSNTSPCGTAAGVADALDCSPSSRSPLVAHTAAAAPDTSVHAGSDRLHESARFVHPLIRSALRRDQPGSAPYNARRPRAVLTP